MAFIVSSLSIPAHAAVKAGGTCKTKGQVKTVSGLKYKCIKSGKKLVWNKGVAVKKSTPTATPAPLVFNWIYKSEVPLIPGTLLDGSPNEVQDNNLNSSFVVQALQNGLPAKGVKVNWVSSDPTSKVIEYSKETDQSGLARIWYFSGRDDSQEISVSGLGIEDQKLSIKLNKASSISPTVGRYVATYFSAPGYLTKGTNYESFTIKATPKTAPNNTYYQLITTWQNKNPGDTSFYGGIQQINCNLTGLDYAVGVCDGSRGELNGRLALFSAWTATTPRGVVAPKVVNLGKNARCVNFSHEGSGLSCSVPLDWQVNILVTWKVEVLGTFVENFTRVRSSILIGDSKEFVEFATLDLPDSPNLTTIAPFVEQWAGNEAVSCLDVDLRELEINSIVFSRNGLDYRPVYAQAMGGMYSETTTRCNNYNIKSTSTGITIKSGGLNNWVDLNPILARNSNNLPFKLGFIDLYQSLWFWQDLDVSTLKMP
jgi:hypothetical protein